MTLNQLIETANNHVSGLKCLKEEQLQYILQMLELYGEEVLSPGDTMQEGFVTMKMFETGKVEIELNEKGNLKAC